ncbi:hypothetical protein [Aestuariivirga sp.]|uniref:hypothetical protein n=1 Tax=Aestuariivirga sp. TaxID=2650926 RepID=UPI00391A49D8
MSEGEEKIVTHDGTTLPLPRKRTLFDLLPSPQEAAREITNGDPTDNQVNARWLYGDCGKAPR